MLAAATAVATVACGGTLPEPPGAAQLAAAFVEVPTPPPPPRVGIVPARPDAPVTVWVNGAWLWQGTRWRWDSGGWFVPPPGGHYARWAAKRREDGTLLYAGPQWFDSRGAPIAPPPPVIPAAAVGGKSEQAT